ncbi:MAG: hypothetical protein IJ077_08160, partial [Eubacterium sp.]|nr:hypothetical protein [Eubacterium sp.]
PIYDVTGNRMYSGMDFYFSYKDNINIGTAYAVVNGIGKYVGKVKTLKFRIVKPAVKPAPIKASTLNVSLARTSYTYDGRAKKPNVIVKTKAGKTVSGANYTASYAGARKNVGAYTVTVTFKNGYTGTVKRTFRIYPRATSISKLTPGKKSFTAKWSKQTAQVTGYQVQYCVRSNFKGAKTVTVGSAKTASKKIANVAGNKKYYVRVRTYKTVGKTRYYSSWSKAKAVKTK